MTRPRVLCGLLLASAVLACFAGWLVMSSGPRVTRAKFERVKKGMTREEVIRTVGSKPGDYSSDDGNLVFGPGILVSGHHYDSWISNDGGLYVWFDETGGPFTWLWRIGSSGAAT
jgi:hypothetical protein